MCPQCSKDFTSLPAQSCMRLILKRESDLLLVSGRARKENRGGLCGTPTYIVFVSAQLCPTLCDPVNCGPPGSSVYGESPGKNTGVGCQALLQGIFAIQGSNPGLLHCRWIPYCLSHQRSLISIIHHIEVLLGKISLSHDVFHLVMMFSPSYTLHDSTW